MQKDGNTKTYAVKSAYSKLLPLTIIDLGFFFEEFWRSKALPFTHFFTWRLIIGNIVTADNLQARSINIGERICLL